MMEVTASGLVTQRFLHGMQASQLDELAETASEVMFPSGHRIFADGDYADKFWLIESGYVALDVLVPGQGQVVIGRVGIGGLVGWWVEKKRPTWSAEYTFPVASGWIAGESLTGVGLVMWENGPELVHKLLGR